MYIRLVHAVLIALVGAIPVRGQDASPDEALWGAIETLARSAPTGEPFEARFSSELVRRQALLEKTQGYLRIYPGGRRRDEAIALELETLFEIASVRGDFGPLAARLSALERTPPSDAARAEAGWWRLHCDRARSTATRPAARSLEDGDREVLAAYRDYVGRFPRSRHALHALVRLADDARSRGDLDAARRWVTQLAAEFPDNALAEGAAARLRLAQNVGQPFAVKLRGIDGAEVDTSAYAGDLVLICVWDSTRAESREFAQGIEAFVAAGPARRALGICLAGSADLTRQAAHALGIPWTQCNDGLGRGGEFVRQWGIRETPTVLVVDGCGRLVGSGDAQSWRALAERALSANPIDSQPARK